MRHTKKQESRAPTQEKNNQQKLFLTNAQTLDLLTKVKISYFQVTKKNPIYKELKRELRKSLRMLPHQIENDKR